MHVLIPDAGFLITIALIAAVTVGIWVLALVDISRRSDGALMATGLPRVAWLVIVIVGGPVGGLAYLIVARSRLGRT